MPSAVAKVFEYLEFAEREERLAVAGRPTGARQAEINAALEKELFPW